MAGHLEGGVGHEALGMAHEPAQVLEVQEALLEAVGDLGEVREVADRRDAPRGDRAR